MGEPSHRQASGRTWPRDRFPAIAAAPSHALKQNCVTRGRNLARPLPSRGLPGHFKETGHNDQVVKTLRRKLDPFDRAALPSPPFRSTASSRGTTYLNREWSDGSYGDGKLLVTRSIKQEIRNLQLSYANLIANWMVSPSMPCHSQFVRPHGGSISHVRNFGSTTDGRCDFLHAHSVRSPGHRAKCSRASSGLNRSTEEASQSASLGVTSKVRPVVALAGRINVNV